MLDAVLAGVSSFGGSDAIGNVADEGDVLAPGAACAMAKVRVAAEDGLNFNEVDAPPESARELLWKPGQSK